MDMMIVIIHQILSLTQVMQYLCIVPGQSKLNLDLTFLDTKKGPIWKHKILLFQSLALKTQGQVHGQISIRIMLCYCYIMSSKFIDNWTQRHNLQWNVNQNTIIKLCSYVTSLRGGQRPGLTSRNYTELHRLIFIPWCLTMLLLTWPIGTTLSEM